MSESQPHCSPEAEDLFAEYLSRTAGDERAEFEALCTQHAELAPELLVLRSQWDALAPVLERAEQNGSLSSRLRRQWGRAPAPGAEFDRNTPAAELGPASELLRRLQAQGPKSERYKLLGELARGGMGAILRIWDDDLRRPLAMKVVLARDDPKSKSARPFVEPLTLGRFLEEAQITSQLDHPGIVPVHELGLAADGRAYFTMRLVKGRDLKHIFALVHDDKEGWNQTRALGVLLKVCEAMSYAHAKGVIHRDLKPANVMVGKYGEVYVMDWGLARVLGREDKHDLRLRPQPSSSVSAVRTERHAQRDETPDSPLVTMDGDVVGTPSYMPPEQAIGQLDQLGPWSDVYSLGAMLYHLLGREMPYVPAGTRLSQHTVLLSVIAGPPKSLYELAPSIPAELGAICEKAMARNMSARYRDMHALSSDLRAYLEGRVVTAYEVGAWAEARKWVRRNRSLAGALAAILLSLVVFGVTATLLYRRSVRGESSAITNEARALAKAIEAQQSAAEAALQRDAADEARKRAERLQSELERMAGSLSSTMTELSTLLEERERRSSADAHFRYAVATAGRSLGEDKLLAITAKSISDLAMALGAQDKSGATESLCREALERFRDTFGEQNLVTLSAANSLALILAAQHKLPQAEEQYRDAIDGYRDAVGSDDRRTLGAVVGLASVLEAQDNLPEAEALLRDVVDRAVRNFGNHDELSVRALGQLIELYQKWHERDPSAGHDAQASELTGRREQ